MRKTMAAACAAISLATASAAAATVTTPGPVLQRFKLVIANRSSRVLASGVVVSGQGTAVRTSPTSFDLSFPSGPGSLTEEVTAGHTSLSPGCVERLSQTGTFSFSYTPTAQPGFRFGGDGTFTSTGVIVYRRLAGGGCDTAAPPLIEHVKVDAGATEVFGVG